MTPEERKLKIKLYGKGYAMLEKTLKKIPSKAWKFKPSPTDWSIHEVIVHLADSESNAALRARLLAAEPGKGVMAMDQDKWAVSLNYHDTDTGDALKLVKSVRRLTHKWLKTLPDACIDLIYIDPPFNSNRNYEVFWGETKEKRAEPARREATWGSLTRDSSASISEGAKARRPPSRCWNAAEMG